MILRSQGSFKGSFKGSLKRSFEGSFKGSFFKGPYKGSCFEGRLWLPFGLRGVWLYDLGSRVRGCLWVSSAWRSS